MHSCDKPRRKQTTQMAAVRQNILITVMLKNDKISNGYVRLHLPAPEICQTRKLLSQSYISVHKNYLASVILSLYENFEKLYVPGQIGILGSWSLILVCIPTLYEILEHFQLFSKSLGRVS